MVDNAANDAASALTMPSALLRGGRRDDDACDVIDEDDDDEDDDDDMERGGKDPGARRSTKTRTTTTDATMPYASASSRILARHGWNDDAAGDADGGGGTGVGGNGSGRNRRRPWFASSSSSAASTSSYATSHSSSTRTSNPVVPSSYDGRRVAFANGTSSPAPAMPSSLLKSNVTGVTYRSASSTRRALEEIQRKKAETRERRRAISGIVGLLALAMAIRLIGVGRGMDDAHARGEDLQRDGERNANDVGVEGGGRVGSDDGGGGEGGDAVVGDYEYRLPPPVEKDYDPEHAYLAPLRHFSDVSDPLRTESDTAFFFHVPRSGGSTVKTIIGKCLRLVQASEVGVRDGHGTDPLLQVLEVQESRFVNVDTTTVPGIHRAAEMGLTASGLADVVVSSYLHESAAMFDLFHQGRAFIVMRDPIDRATSMYYHRLKTLGDLDSTITIEDYAQGNGIENNWVCRYLANRMAGELTKEDLDQAKEVLRTKFLIGFLDDLEESVHQMMKFNEWKYSDDETAKMKQEDCIKELAAAGGGTNRNAHEYEIPKRGSQAHALISWQTQFDSKLYAYAKELFDRQTKEWGTKERKKALKKEKKNKGG